jgi:hypothetical protein
MKLQVLFSLLFILFVQVFSQNCPSVDPEIVVQFPHPDCTKFYKCLNGEAFEMECPDDLYYNPTLQVCDYPE